MQRARPVLLTALAAVLAFSELTSSVFWGSMAYVLVGGTAIGTVLILMFLPALYTIWYRIRRAPESAPATHVHATSKGSQAAVAGAAR